MSDKLKNDTLLFITSGYLVGQCEKCEQPSTGKFDGDDDRDEDEMYWISMKCVSCSNIQRFNIEPEVAAFEYEEPSQAFQNERRE